MESSFLIVSHPYYYPPTPFSAIILPFNQALAVNICFDSSSQNKQFFPHYKPVYFTTLILFTSKYVVQFWSVGTAHS